MSRQNLKNVLVYLIEKSAILPDSVGKVDFIYIPIFERNNMSVKWRRNVEKDIDTSHNSAHGDLILRDRINDEASSIALVLSSKLAEPNNRYCEVILEVGGAYDNPNWIGAKLCKQH